MKIGVFGGTFDPPHLGHLALCRAAQRQLGLDRLEVIPSAIPPHRDQPRAEAIDRYAMVALMLRNEDHIAPSPRELLRQGTSFTVDTLDELRQEQAGAELFLIIGGDSYDDLPNWRSAPRIPTLAHLAVIARPGADGVRALREGDLARLKTHPAKLSRGSLGVFDIAMEPCPWSATEVRRQLAAGEQDIEALDPAVLHYLRTRGLYTGGNAR